MIKVTVQTEKRMNAINNLAQAINTLANALHNGPRVELTGCHINGGIAVETTDEATETTVLETDTTEK